MKSKLIALAASLLIMTNISAMNRDTRQNYGNQNEKGLHRQLSLNSISSYGQRDANLPTGSGQTTRNKNNGYNRKTRSWTNIKRRQNGEGSYFNEDFNYLSNLVSDQNDTIQQQDGKITALQKKVKQSESRLVALEKTALWQNKQIKSLMALCKNLSKTRGAYSSNPPIVDPATTDLFLVLSSQKMKIWK